MPDRPAIPNDIKREVFIEAGHRCAVCGTPVPLEHAHIIPWRRSKDHSAENLICLCANCHERADREDWGKKTLGQYKANPWILRRYRTDDSQTINTTSVEIDIDLAIAQFDDKQRRWLQYALASFLDVSPESIRIKAVRQGSVKVTIELPSQAAEHLVDAIARNDPDLSLFLHPMQLSGITPPQPQPEPRRKNRVFIVHGHNEPLTYKIAAFLERLNLQPILLRERPAQGRTIIETIEHLSDVDFAVVLLPADDRGGLISQPVREQLFRARQNVIFEMGYLLAKLGRDRVCVLYEESVKPPSPSDYGGAFFVPLDDQGAWRLMLAREIKAAGVDVDVNKVF